MGAVLAVIGDLVIIASLVIIDRREHYRRQYCVIQ